jgi:iron-sulfur cluster repair protein YtfE (RIC family)
MDPFELLKKDHKTVSKLFERIEAVSGKAKLPVFKQIKSELDLHMHIEESIFYPAIEKAKETRDLTLEAYEEHKVVKELLSELATAKAVSDEWEAKLTVLKENVEHHVDEEEHELFDKANDVLTGEEAERLGDRMNAERVRRGGAPATPETERPGLIETIANALGIGSSKPTTKMAVRKSAGVAAKSSGPKSTKSSAGKKKKTAVGKAKSVSRTKAASPSSGKGAVKKAGKRPTPRKAAAKKTGAKKTKRTR